MPTASQPLALPSFLRLCGLALALTASVRAQMHKVETSAPVTRAVGVYEWTGDLAKPTAARLVPVSLFIDGQFQDAGTYFARPIPLALLNGNVYSLEKSGAPEGTVTLDYARHLQTATNAGTDDSTDLGWFGYGTFATLPVAKKPVPLQASKNPSQIVSSKDADRPTFAKRPAQSKAERDAPDPATVSKVTPVNSSPDDDPDRPRLNKPKASSTPATTTTSDTTATSDTTPDTKPNVTTKTDASRPDADDADRPTLRHRSPGQVEADRQTRRESRVEPVGSLNNDPNRPTMKRGKTPQQQAAAQLTGLPAELHQTIAISDAVNREPHPFARNWSSPTERAGILARLQPIAQKQLADYARTNNAEAAASLPKPRAIPRSRTAPGARRSTPVKPLLTPTAPLTSETLTSLTLSYGGLPTFVYSAIAPSGPPPSPTPAGPSTPPPYTEPERYVTVVAQQLPSGELQLAFASVTDAAHLNRTPWFRFVDAVDPNASHRASLLFELRAQHSRQFALYTILTAKADQQFLTNPTD